MRTIEPEPLASLLYGASEFAIYEGGCSIMDKSTFINTVIMSLIDASILDLSLITSPYIVTFVVHAYFLQKYYTDIHGPCMLEYHHKQDVFVKHNAPDNGQFQLRQRSQGNIFLIPVERSCQKK